MTPNRAYALGTLLGLVAGILLVVTARIELNPLTWSFLVGVMAFVGFGLALVAVTVAEHIDDRRSGRLKAYQDRRRAAGLVFRRWTWPLSIGAAAGFVGMLAFVSRDSSTDFVVAFLCLITGALMGTVLAAAVERLVAGPGEALNRRLGSFLFTGPVAASACLAGALILGLSGLRFGFAYAAGSVLLGGMFGWAAAEFVSALLEPFDRGRELLPRAIVASRAEVALEIAHAVVTDGADIDGMVRLRTQGLKVQLRVELVLRVSARVRTPVTDQPDGRADVEFTEVVDEVHLPTGAVTWDRPGSFVLKLPRGAPPSVDVPGVAQVAWSVRAVAAVPRRVDREDELQVEVVPPLPNAAPVADPELHVSAPIHAGSVVRASYRPDSGPPSDIEVNLHRRITTLLELGETTTTVIRRLRVHPVDGAALFVIGIPESQPPTITASTVALVDWWLEVKEARDESRRVPIVVHSARRPGDSLPANLRRPRRTALVVRLVALALGLAVPLGLYALAGGAPDRLSPSPRLPPYVPPSIPSFRLPTVPSFDIPSFGTPRPLLPPATGD